MRHLIFLLPVIISINSFGQAQDENFYLNDDKLTWQKAYATDKTKEEVFNYFMESNILDKAKIEGNIVVAKLTPQFVDEKKVGIPGVPEIIRDNDFIGDVIVDYKTKEKEYVITVSNLQFLGRGDHLKKNEKQDFEEQFVRIGYNKYRPGFLKRPKEVYNFTISPIFEMN